MKEEVRKKKETKIRKKVKEKKDNGYLKKKNLSRQLKTKAVTYLPFCLSVFPIKQYRPLRTDTDVDIHIYLYTYLMIYHLYISWYIHHALCVI